MKQLEFNRAAKELLCRLCEQYPDTPFLALGQTVFWDEPTKALFVQMLQECVPKATFWHGVHDTDYFSRLPRPLPGPRPFAIVEHNDSSTSGLWVAMCEASRLFGAEVVPTRAKFRHYGSNLHRALTAQSQPFSLDEITSAWGWRGIVSTGGRELVAREVMLTDLSEELIALVQWAMQDSQESLAEPTARAEAAKLAEQIAAELRAFQSSYPEATLTALYQQMLTRFYELLLGKLPPNLKLTASGELFRFNPQTASRPLFAPLALFLAPATRELAQRAYNDAVAGSGIYTLEHFGPGAIPFDLVVPGRGRGTILLSPRDLIIDTPEQIYLPLAEPVETPAQLAAVLAARLGEEVALVGKAVMLIPMIAQEFILLFHAGASAYTEHTHEFVEALERAGVILDCHPILRLHHQAWDALRAVPRRFSLPAHFAQAFGAKELTGPELAARWRRVAREQAALLQSLAQAKKYAQLAELLSGLFANGAADGKEWERQLAQYREATQTLARFGEEIDTYQARVSRLRNQAFFLRREIQRLQAEKGRHFREGVKPRLEGGQPDQGEATAERARRQQEIELQQKRLADLGEEIGQAKQAQHAREEREEYLAASRAKLLFEEQAEAARLRLVRNALLATEGLEVTNRRPTAWWFKLVSPEGDWFAELARSSSLEVEAFCRNKVES